MSLRFRICLFLLVCNYLLVAQSNNSNIQRGEPGKCYAKCLVEDKFDYWEESYPVYLGNPNDNFIYLEKIDLILEEGRTKWVKKKADRNCLSENPDNCLVWVLLEVPEKIEQITVVTDTLKTINYKWKSYHFSELMEKGGFTEWREVICDYKVTPEINSQIQIALQNEGYYNGPIDNLIDITTKDALIQFQKDHGLPVGNLNI